MVNSSCPRGPHTNRKVFILPVFASALMWYLTCHRSADTFAIVGHSTGCQNAVHFCKVSLVFSLENYLYTNDVAHLKNSNNRMDNLIWLRRPKL